MQTFTEWLASKQQNEMGLDYLRINPERMSRGILKPGKTALDDEIHPHAGEFRMLTSDKLKKCLTDKFARLNIPVHIVMDPKPTPEEKTPDPNALKILIKDRGGDPMTCWMVLHRVGHSGLGYQVKKEIWVLLNNWFKEYVKYYPEWGYHGADAKKNKDGYDDWTSLEEVDVKFPLSKFLMFLSARKTAEAVKRWASKSLKKRWARPPQHSEDLPLRNPLYYSSLEPKSYALDEEFYHELVAEYLWNGKIRVNEDPEDSFVRDNPGYITKMFGEISEIIHQKILSLKGKVLDQN